MSMQNESDRNGAEAMGETDLRVLGGRDDEGGDPGSGTKAGLTVGASRDDEGGDTGSGTKAGLTVGDARDDTGGDTPPIVKPGLTSKARKAGDEAASS
jgi:hypothetical protein